MTMAAASLRTFNEVQRMCNSWCQKKMTLTEQKKKKIRIRSRTDQREEEASINGCHILS
jgi:hypothetical protein